MYHAILSGAFHGMDIFLVQVEVDVSNGIPCMEMVGCLASEVKETKERVRVGIKNSGYEMPVKRITISLSPADIRKDGSGFDLPVALGILGASLLEEDNQRKNNSTIYKDKISNVIVMGELGLNGEVKGARGILPVLLKAAEEKITNCIIPFDNRLEASNVKGMQIYAVKNLQEAFGAYCAIVKESYVKAEEFCVEITTQCDRDDTDVISCARATESTKQENSGEVVVGSNKTGNTGDKIVIIERGVVEGKASEVRAPEEKSEGRSERKSEVYNTNKKTVDFSQVYGQEHAKRAAMIAAAGFHNLLLFGPPGSGKSMIAERIPTIMPNMCYEECMELTKIYSVAGQLDNKTTLVTKRPFLSPHHTVTDSALVGGGSVPKPGIITLAHKGVLFLDELPEFGRTKLDLLRQPLEEKRVQISRMLYTCNYAADFMLVAAMNPCPCGFYPDRNKCNCRPYEIERYLGNISGPLLDRIDLSVEVGRMKWEQIFGEPDAEQRERYTDSASMKQQVCDAIARQMARSGKYNSALTGDEIESACILTKEAELFLRRFFEKMGLSVRSLLRIKKVARTIADLEGAEIITQMHISEAIMLNKGLERLKRKKVE